MFKPTSDIHNAPSGKSADPMQKDKNSRFQQSLKNPDEFTLTFELVPGRGAGKEYIRPLKLAENIASDSRFHAVSITENAGGIAALSPDALGHEIQKMGLDVIVHFSCKDKNRNQMESLLLAWNRIGIRDLLVITGDYPKQGYKGLPKPVFDLGSVHVLNLISKMNKGDFSTPSQSEGINSTSFCTGVAFSPFKRQEAELMMQYYKLHRKATQGADYLITQVGFDARKFHEIILYIKENKLNLPILGNVFIPNLGVTELMHKGKIPGCVITDELYTVIKEEAKGADRGKKARLIRAAKLLALQQGLGYSGAHIGGPGLKYEDLDFLLNKAADFLPHWQELIPEFNFWHEDGFYLYEKDLQTGLNKIPPQASNPGPKAGFSLNYHLARTMHNLAFEPNGALYPLFQKTCYAIEESRLEGAITHIEHVIKFLIFGCQNCGDCTLGDLAFVCPQSGCAKYLINGPCGGSRDGWCEVYPGKKRCLYVRIYERLKSQGLPDTMQDGFVPPRNWALNNTSAWVNFYLGRDHTIDDK
jgi:methylenetetrahydrofolate reductase (NADPH)